MSTSITRQQRCRKTLRRVAAVIVTAGVASSTLAAPASAVGPVDSFTISLYGAWTHFGNGCTIAGPPAGTASLDWDENAAQTTVRPHLTGQICIQDSSGVNARVKIEFCDQNWVPIGRQIGGIATGNGGLHVANVDLRSSTRFSSALMHHIRVVLLDDRAVPGTFAEVGSSAEWY